ncbi:MAG: hypothetical protein AB1700_13690, partial [Bacillota bacterium]
MTVTKGAYPTAGVLPIRHRLGILLVYSVALYLVGGFCTNSWVPSGGGDDLWLASAIALVSSTLVCSYFFVTPSDSLVNALATALLLW